MIRRTFLTHFTHQFIDYHQKINFEGKLGVVG